MLPPSETTLILDKGQGHLRAYSFRLYRTHEQGCLHSSPSGFCVFMKYDKVREKYGEAAYQETGENGLTSYGYEVDQTVREMAFEALEATSSHRGLVYL